MNTEKAIKLLREMQEAWKVLITWDAFDALELAITALENNSNEQLNNSTATQFNAIKTHVKGLTACRVPEVAKDTNVLNNDTISRQAAIDAILAVTGNSSVRELYEHVQEHGLSDMWSGGVNAAIDIIIAVPPVQPEIIRCKDCRWRKDQSGSTAWLPCRAMATPSDFYCCRAERRTDER